jgi:hypothetical protein
LSRKKPGSRKNTFFRADVKKLRGGKNQQLQKRGLSGQALGKNVLFTFTFT